MNIATNLSGRLRNTSLPLSNGLLPLFEAVINSIHGIEEASVPPVSWRIRVVIEREPSLLLLDGNGDRKSGGHPLPDITGFKVIDNGVGFNEDNFQAFLTLDTDHKVAKGGRGIGRLLWLKAFDNVEVESTFDEGDVRRRRTFAFSKAGITGGDSTDAPSGSPRETVVRLRGFAPAYRAKARKTPEAIANALIEHCLWYFVRQGGCPSISIEDDGTLLSLDDVFEQQMHSQAVRQEVKLKDRAFDLLHVKLRASAAPEHAIAYCANNRLVLEEKLAGRVPGLHGSLSDDDGAFTYVCYVNSTVLDERVRPERSAFDLPADVEGLFEGTEIGWIDIRNMVIGEASRHLDAHLADVKRRAAERVTKFVAESAPRYRPIVSRLESSVGTIDPDITDKELELTLHRHFADLERQLMEEGQSILSPQFNETATAYKQRVSDYLKKVEDVKMSDLAGYVAHRRVVIDLLQEAIRKDDQGHYVREDLIHTLIMPMRADSTQVDLDSCNLWLVDERLAFHNYLASDLPLKSIPITGATSTQEPDIVALNVFDNPMVMSETKAPPYASLVVIELKRPMRNDDSDPVEQALDYLRKIRKGSVQTAAGRPIPNSEDIPGFCYVICDLTPKVIERCVHRHQLTVTSDHMGYFGHMRNDKAYVEVTSFDRLVNAAKERNRAFFDKLGLPLS